MELNQAQLLTHDDAAMEKFRKKHNIPNDVAIERLRPMEEANTVHECTPTTTISDCRSLINLKHAWFIDAPDKDMYLNEFVWVSRNWAFRARDDGLWSFPRYNGYVPARETRKVVDLLNCILVYRHVIPHRADRLSQVRLPILRIRERASQRCKTILEELSEELSENARIAQALDQTSKNPLQVLIMQVCLASLATRTKLKKVKKSTEVILNLRRRGLGQVKLFAYSRQLSYYHFGSRLSASLLSSDTCYPFGLPRGMPVRRVDRTLEGPSITFVMGSIKLLATKLVANLPVGLPIAEWWQLGSLLLLQGAIDPTAAWSGL
ncbi:hypothetical protein Acr_25g0010380 [Actinidia rufa]|uniref:Uncharacterized protein n=1 Tax=Actinidia rufa TaxID=165716 RepID=A0A7J0H0N4_9ERIC|nr:hypothetical protein Acr_25g0010380 [Actinidia rufa]